MRKLPPVLAWLAAGCIACHAAGPVAHVAPVAGVPTFFLDGAPFLTPAFETYVPKEHYFKAFAGAGSRVMMFNANAVACDYGHSANVHPAPGEWDYTQLDERAAAALKADAGALLLPRVNLGTPRWWLDAHPEALEVLHDGAVKYFEPNRNPTQPKDRPFPALTSPAWRTLLEDGLRRLVAHVQASPYADRIFGYEITGLDTEEWYHWSAGSDQLAGYSAHTAAAFQAWLRGRYPDDAALQAAWGRPEVSLSTATVPTHAARTFTPGPLRDPVAQRDVIDFYRFYNELVPDTIDHFARVLKEAAGPGKPVGAFYGYMYEFQGDPEYGHNALARFASRPHLDFMAVTASYFNRAPGMGGDYLRSPLRSLWKGGKLWYHDNDTVSVLGRAMHGLDAPGGNPAMAGQLALLGMADSIEGSRWMYRRGAGFALCNGLFNAFFDLHGGYFDHPELMQEIASLNAIFSRAADKPLGPIAEVLVVADEPSCEHFPFRSPALAECLLPPQHRLVQLGAPVDHVLLGDLPGLDLARYRLVIVLNAVRVPEAARAALAASPAMVLWCYAPGYAGENGGGPAAMHAITGLPVRLASPAPGPRALRLEGALGEATAWPSAEIQTHCGQFDLGDGEMTVLDRYADDGHPAIALAPGGRTLYSATPNLPTPAYRALARYAGVHLYTGREDTFYANASYLTLHANGDGPRTLQFPVAVDLLDPASGAPLAKNVRQHEVDLRHGETVLLEWRAATP